jgi:hypothetical protein
MENTEQKQITDIEKCIGDVYIDDDLDLLQSTDPKTLIFDLSVSLKTRLRAVELCVEQSESATDMLDTINRIGTMYFFSESRIIEEYLYNLVVNSNIEIFLKLACAQHLLSYSKKGYDCFDYLCEVKTDEMPIISRVDCMFTLIKSEDFFERAGNYIENFLTDRSIDCGYRYKTVIVRANNIPTALLNRMLLKFIEGVDPATYRILACQYILVNCDDVSSRDRVQAKLTGYLEDYNLAYNARADACDVLLQYGDAEHKKLASIVLDNLARDGKMEIRTVFENAQNVHIKSIEESAQKNLCRLIEKVAVTMSFEKAAQEVGEMLTQQEYKEEVVEKVQNAISRVFLDRARYGSTQLTLSAIFVYVWTYIKDHEYSDELKRRFVEELHDSSEICSSGYAVRMINTLTGFTDMGVSISFEDQIISNLATELNREIMKIDDEKTRDLLLEEMILPSQMYHLRTNFLKFFREVISGIREGLYNEFKAHITDTDFDLYIRKAVLKYQGDYIV